MKKTILAMAIMAVTMISCQDKTKEKVNDATEAIGEDIDSKLDTAAVKIDTAIDSAQSKTGEALEKGAEKMKEGAENMKEAAKK